MATNNNIRELIISVLFAAILAIPAFWWGGRDINGQSLLFLLLLPLAFFIYKLKGQLDFDGVSWPFAFVAAFLFIGGISIFYSPEKYGAISQFFILLASVLFGFLAFNFIDSAKKIQYFGYFVVGLGIILSLIGVYDFLLSQNFGYLRLVSTFYHHIPFGEFITYPFLIGIGLLFLGNPPRRRKIWLIFADSFFAITFFFNHCRGAWLSLAAVLFLLIIIFRKRIFNKSALFSAIAVLAITAIGIWGIFQLKAYQARQFSASSSQKIVAIYNGTETLQENAASVRWLFWQRAWDIFKNAPLGGGGLASFAVYHKQYLQPPFYYSIDPHNFYLKVLAELGIFGLAAFLGFAAIVLFYCAKLLSAIKKRGLFNSVDVILISMVGGIVSALMNNAINFGWAFPANLIIFFFSCGVVLKALPVTKSGNHKINLLICLLIFILSGALMIFGIVIFIANYYFQRSQLLFEDKEFVSATDNLVRAQEVNPINPDYSTQLSLIYFSLAQNSDNNGPQSLDKAINSIDNAIKWSDSPENLLLKGKIILARGDSDAAQKFFLQTIAKFPYGINENLQLAKLYWNQDKFSEIHALLNPFLVKYKKEYILSPLYMDPNIDETLANISAMHKINADAYQKEGDDLAAEEEYQQANFYYSKQR